jgi:hypothetical protein
VVYINKIFGKAAANLTPYNLIFSKNSHSVIRPIISPPIDTTTTVVSGHTSTSKSHPKPAKVPKPVTVIPAPAPVYVPVPVPSSSISANSLSSGVSISVGSGVSVSSLISVNMDIGQIISVSQSNVFSTQWITSYGNPLNNPISPNGLTFKMNDFIVPYPGTPGQSTFQGTIEGIQGYSCHAVDEKNNSYTLYFGGGTNI